MAADPLDALRTMIAEVVRQEIAKAGLAPKPAGADGYLSVAQAAELASVAPGTIRRWVREGELPDRRAGRVLRVRRADLEELLRRGGDRRDRDEDLSPAELARRHAARDLG